MKITTSKTIRLNMGRSYTIHETSKKPFVAVICVVRLKERNQRLRSEARHGYYELD